VIEEAEALYGLEPSAFVAARGLLVKSLRADGRRADATEVARLRRPLLAEHALNMAARNDPTITQAWSDAVTNVEQTQRDAIEGSSGSAEALRAAVGELRAATASLVDAAVRSLDDVRDRDARRHDIVTVVRALTSPEGAQVVRRGVVGAEPMDEPELFAGVAEPPARTSPKPPDHDMPGSAKRAVPHQPVEHPTVDARDERRVARERDEAQRATRVALDADVDAAVARAEHAATGVTDAAQAVTDAVAALADARAGLVAAEVVRDAADRELADLQRRRDELPIPPPSRRR